MYIRWCSVANRLPTSQRAARTWRQGLKSSPLALMHLW